MIVCSKLLVKMADLCHIATYVYRNLTFVNFVIVYSFVNLRNVNDNWNVLCDFVFRLKRVT